MQDSIVRGTLKELLNATDQGLSERIKNPSVFKGEKTLAGCAIPDAWRNA